MNKNDKNKVEEPNVVYEVPSNNDIASDDLHPVLLKLLEKSIKQADEGKLIPHDEVMKAMKEKFPFLK